MLRRCSGRISNSEPEKNEGHGNRRKRGKNRKDPPQFNNTAVRSFSVFSAPLWDNQQKGLRIEIVWSLRGPTDTITIGQPASSSRRLT